jgi:hypothetical protein
MAEPSEAAWQKVQLYCQRLVEALDQLDDAGGLKGVAPAWKPAARDKARKLLAEARQALDAALSQLKAAPSSKR